MYGAGRITDQQEGSSKTNIHWHFGTGFCTAPLRVHDSLKGSRAKQENATR